MIRHHPDDALLMSLAAGAVARGPAVVIAAHTELCPRCSTRLREFETVGGLLLEQLEPESIANDVLTSTLARIDKLKEREETPKPAMSVEPNLLQASLPAGMTWPHSLHGSKINSWRRLGPGVRWTRVTLANGTGNVHLLRVSAQKALPVHGHRGGELSQVLYGAFHDHGERFGVGDFIEADDKDRHRPVVEADDECVCLISMEGHVAFDGPLARMLGSFLGM